MIRRAVIIASPLKRGQRGFLPGVEVDVQNYKSFLTSPVGGSWLPNEIKVLWNPSRISITQELHRYRTNYALTVYSGHGGTCTRTGRAFVNINRTEAVYLNHLAANTPRQLVIVDACSVYAHPGIAGIGDPDILIPFTSSLTVRQARALFERRVKESPYGWTVLHSASPGEAALDALEGGVFSQSLLRSVSNWAAKYQLNSILPVPVAYEHSYKYLKKVFQANQTPRIWHSQTNPNLPFAFRYGTELSNR